MPLAHKKKSADVDCNASRRDVGQNEDGFVLITTLVILIMLIMLGISTTTTTNIELQIAGNDKVNKVTFYAADGSVDLGSRMVEENVACPNGFTNAAIGAITIQDLDFWRKLPGDLLDSTLATIDFDGANVAGDNDGRDDRAFTFPVSSSVTSDVVIAGTTKFASGSSIQMVSGYEGKGKGAAAGGSYISYDIVVQANGSNNSRAEVQLGWNHIIGQEGNCNY